MTGSPLLRHESTSRQRSTTLRPWPEDPGRRIDGRQRDRSLLQGRWFYDRAAALGGGALAGGRRKAHVVEVAVGALAASRSDTVDFVIMLGPMGVAGSRADSPSSYGRCLLAGRLGFRDRAQMTSHGAAVDFAVTHHGPLARRSLGELLAAQWVPIAVLLMLSVLAGLAAGWREAEGVVLRGYLDRELELLDRA